MRNCIEKLDVTARVGLSLVALCEELQYAVQSLTFLELRINDLFLSNGSRKALRFNFKRISKGNTNTFT
jgi:hypothetical protein